MTVPLQSRPPNPVFSPCALFPPDCHPPGHQPCLCRPGAYLPGLSSPGGPCRLWTTGGPETGRGEGSRLAGWMSYTYTRGRGLSPGRGTSPEGWTVLLCDPVPHLQWERLDEGTPAGLLLAHPLPRLGAVLCPHHSSLWQSWPIMRGSERLREALRGPGQGRPCLAFSSGQALPSLAEPDGTSLGI